VEQVERGLDGGEKESRECPNCYSKKNWKAGLRETSEGFKLQRYKCRSCHVRFSDANPYKMSNTNNNSQLCAILQVAKKLDSPTELKTVDVGENSLIKYAWLQKRRGLAESTINLRVGVLRQLQLKGADLNDPESVETVLATENFTKMQKFQSVECYRSYCKFLKIPWEPIKVNYEPKQPFVPTNEEMSALIHAAGKTTATFLQVAIDTGARCGELCKLKWTDFDAEKLTVSINDAEKGSRCRTIKVTSKTAAMIQALKPKYQPYLFNPNPDTIRQIFSTLRNTLAETQKNPRFKQIHLHTFRHFYACKLYFETKDIVLVKEKLGHRSIENTMRYTHLVDWETPDSWIVKRPLTTAEEDQLIQAGFEYVRFDERNQCPIYRRRK
jgi:transposase-like protein